MALDPRSLVLVSLEPHPDFGHLVSAIRDLKARGSCNVAIIEGGRPYHLAVPMDGVRDVLDVPAFVLCGYSIGDAGFTGTLPKDRTVMLPETATGSAS